jgi:hypothetical protein
MSGATQAKGYRWRPTWVGTVGTVGLSRSICGSPRRSVEVTAGAGRHRQRPGTPLLVVIYPP